MEMSPFVPKSNRFVNKPIKWPSLRYIFRVLGLGLFVVKTREDKIVVYASLWASLAHGCLHILPVLISATLLWLNFYGVYIGSDLFGPTNITDDVKIHLLQFGAKIHEMLIIASTSTVVFAVIREQLIWGSGVPLGLIGSGINFSDLGFFWYSYLNCVYLS